MKIIQPGRTLQSPGHSGAAQEGVPFVVAYDLLELEEQRLSDEEAVAVALALQALTSHASPRPSASSLWGITARSESASQTVLESV